MLIEATDVGKWEAVGHCRDCSSREICPFRKNAEWLRHDVTRKNLVKVLRRGELAGGQRWNFRDAYSLIAELLIGQWNDFGDAPHPCNWVHQCVTSATVLGPDPASIIALTAQLYPHAMFRGGHVRQAAKIFQESRHLDPQAQPLTLGLIGALATIGEGGSAKSIRETLSRDYSRLDPATATPSNPSDALRIIEDEFCQSIEQGKLAARQPTGMSPIEDLLLGIFDQAEHEWDLLGREFCYRCARGVLATETCWHDDQAINRHSDWTPCP